MNDYIKKCDRVNPIKSDKREKAMNATAYFLVMWLVAVILAIAILG
jgi:hypothetical protein